LFSSQFSQWQDSLKKCQRHGSGGAVNASQTGLSGDLYSEESVGPQNGGLEGSGKIGAQISCHDYRSDS
jgi:hypothetical protein